MYISKKNSRFFPSGDKSVKITGMLDEEEIELTYDPKRRRILGLINFYRRHNAEVGDEVEITILEPFKKYKFKLVKALKRPEKAVRRSKRALVGPPINFRGLIYAPVNENGVIFLFSKVADDLGIIIEGIQAKFPDAFGKMYVGNKGYQVTIEFEYRSSDYKRHKHPLDGCDLIICWEHDWKESPIKVIELKSLISELTEKAKG